MARRLSIGGFMRYVRTKDGIYGVYTKDLDLNDKTDRDIAGFRAQTCY